MNTTNKLGPAPIVPTSVAEQQTDQPPATEKQTFKVGDWVRFIDQTDDVKYEVAVIRQVNGGFLVGIQEEPESGLTEFHNPSSLTLAQTEPSSNPLQLPAETQSAVEWVARAKQSGIEWVPIDRFEDLARRCDDAEAGYATYGAKCKELQAKLAAALTASKPQQARTAVRSTDLLCFMDWREYRQHLKEEWDFHMRNPEMFLVWAVIIGGLIYCLSEA